MTTIATYTTRTEAQAIVTALETVTYYLAHGEYDRPQYSVRKVRGDNRYYIYAKRFFYSGTFYAAPSGPLSDLY